MLLLVAGRREVADAGPGVVHNAAAASGGVLDIPFTFTTKSQRGYSCCILSIVVEANLYHDEEGAFAGSNEH